MRYIGIINQFYDPVYDEFGNFLFFNYVLNDPYGYTEYLDESLSPVKDFFFRSFFVRAWVIYHFSRSISLEITQVVKAGKYREIFQAQNNDPWKMIEIEYEAYANRISFRQLRTGLHYSHRMGEYVSFRFLFNYNINRYEYRFFDKKKTETIKNYENGVSFELVF